MAAGVGDYLKLVEAIEKSTRQSKAYLDERPPTWVQAKNSRKINKMLTSVAKNKSVMKLVVSGLGQKYDPTSVIRMPIFRRHRQLVRFGWLVGVQQKVCIAHVFFFLNQVLSTTTFYHLVNIWLFCVKRKCMNQGIARV